MTGGSSISVYYIGPIGLLAMRVYMKRSGPLVDEGRTSWEMNADLHQFFLRNPAWTKRKSARRGSAGPGPEGTISRFLHFDDGDTVYSPFTTHHSTIQPVNPKVPTTGIGIVESFATRDIIAHKELEFICDCKACIPNSLFQQLSDMRRTLIRGLNFLLTGTDPIGEILNQSSQ